MTDQTGDVSAVPVPDAEAAPSEQPAPPAGQTDAAPATDAPPAEPTPAPDAASAPDAVAGVDPTTSPVPPAGAPEGDGSAEDVEVVETITDDVKVYEHPEPVAFATVVQDNVSEPGVQHTHSLQRAEDGSLDMVKSSHGEPDAQPDAVDATAEAVEPPAGS